MIVSQVLGQAEDPPGFRRLVQDHVGQIAPFDLGARQLGQLLHVCLGQAIVGQDGQVLKPQAL